MDFPFLCSYIRGLRPGTLVALKKHIYFLSQFLKKGNQVGAVAASSKSLVRLMMKPVDFSKAEVLVELGAGTGSVTRGILRRMRPNSRVYVFELNAGFMAQLKSKIHDPRVIWIEESAEHIAEILARHGESHADCVISSLPLAIFPAKVRDNILRGVVKVLRPGGVYVQFQYSLQAFRRLREYFGKVKLNFTPINVPPAFVYSCVKE